MKSFPTLLFALLCAVSLVVWAGCERGSSFSCCDENAVLNPWTHTRFLNQSDQFQFAVVADRTGGKRDGVFAAAVRKLNLLRPSFVLSVGDLIEGYSEDEAVINRQWAEFESLVRTLEMPFFAVPGNHDISNPMMAANWGRRFGRAYYHFRSGDVLFLCMNTEDSAATTITAAQVEYFRDVLRKHRDPRWILVFLHKPMWQHDPAQWEPLKQLLSGRPHTVFAGHHHTYEYDTLGGGEYIKLSVTGGGNELWGPREGKFDHITWVTMTDSGPRVANIALDGIHPKDIRSAASIRRRDSLAALVPISVSPLYTKRGGQTAQSRVRIHNRHDRAIRVEGTLSGGAGLDGCPGYFARTLQPGAQAVVVLTVAPSSPPAHVRPVELTCAVTVDSSAAAPVYHRTALAPAQVHRSDNLRRKRVRVDGDLSEWRTDVIPCTTPAQVRGDVQSWRGAEDGHFAFAVAHDEQFLYVGVRVWDDSLYVDKTKMPWRMDGIEVRLDSRPAPSRWTSAGAHEFDSVLVIAMSPGDDGTPGAVYGAERFPKGTRYACKTTDDGYVGEMAIPVEWLDARRRAPWDTVRVNVAVDDFESANNGAQLWWQPSWRSRINYAGSGSFVRR